MVKIRLAIVASVLAGAMAPVGMAADSSACKPRGYCGQAGSVQGSLEQTSGQLPFTGLQTGLFAAGGGILLLGGAALYRVSRKKA